MWAIARGSPALSTTHRERGIRRRYVDTWHYPFNSKGNADHRAHRKEGIEMTLRRSALRLVAALVLMVLGTGLTAGCTTSNEDATVSCTVSSCTATFDRGVNATASVLGVDVKLVAVDEHNVTVDVAGNQLLVPVNGSQQAGGLVVAVDKVTDKQVVLKLSKV
jgi:hypothetical protein